jgi:transposase-like protein
LAAPDGGTQEWRSTVLPRYARMTRQIEALIAGAYLAGTNTRRVKRALGALFRGTVGKDVVSRTWRKVRTDWEAWSKRDLAGEDIVRLILDGTVVRVRLDRKATNLSLLVVLGVRRDGQKVLLSIRNMAGESEAAWRAVLDGLVARGLRTPEFLITDGAAGLERALAALWPAVPAQRCTVHKHRNLLAHAPDALHDEVSADYTDMIYAASAKEVEQRRRAFLRKWRVRCPAVAASLEEAGERLFAFLRLPSCQWRSARTTNAIERLHEEFKRRIKTQTVLPSAETAAMLFWAELPKVPRAKRVEWQRRGLWPRARSPCARSTAGRPSPSPSAPQFRLTSPLDPSQPHPAGDHPLRLFPHKSRRHPRSPRTRQAVHQRLAARLGVLCCENRPLGRLSQPQERSATRQHGHVARADAPDRHSPRHKPRRQTCG